MNLSRRHWLQTAALVSGVTLLPIQAAHASTRRVERPGVQLYTLREAMMRDAAATLAAVAAAGYAEVELAGTGNLDAAQFAQALRSSGLSAPAAHVPLDAIRNQPDQLLEQAKVIGCTYLVLPWIAPDLRNTAGYTAVIETLNRFGGQCEKAGVQLAYHNHDFEFARVDGEIAYDRLLRECDRELVKFELDLYWVTHAGADGAAYLSATPERFPLCHVKDRSASGEMVDVGQGTINFVELFAAGSGLRHYFVEHDQPKDALASILTSVKALKEIRF
ncbi:MAG: sugar phosphate isomerase/epimerase [Gammaproteobacteria bacterium]|nr:sugar phosphate isomerase/epimerase [Gammaproteobacteria bacterium]